MESMLTGPLGMLTKQRSGPLILELDLTEGVLEARSADPLAALMTRHQATITDVLNGLRLARQDERVKALVAKVGGKPIGLALVQELREAIRGFGATGKATVAWAETFGEFSAGNIPYYLATACDTIYLQPSGGLGLVGLAMERVFLRGALDMLGVTMEVGARHEFKSAAEQLTEHGFSEPAREAARRIAESVTGQLAEAISERRGIPADRVMQLINDGPFLSNQALEAGLVDALGYRDEVYSAVRKLARTGTEEPALMYLGRYQRSKELASRAKGMAGPLAEALGDSLGGALGGALGTGRPDAVALISATGMIRQGRSGRSGANGSAMGSDSITASLRAATADPHIKAIVLRVSSPGGSYVASDSIWREVVRTRNAGKPIVVSMGDVAGSGGYFISMAADAIVAQPGTITGSIGVITAKPVVSAMLGKAGITTDSVVLGGHAAMFSTAHPFSSEEWEIVDRWLDYVYADFTGKVAASRGLSAERVHELARGRIWSGADARDRELVDELGGIEAAAEIARRRAGLPPSAPLIAYPRISPLDRIKPAASSEDRRAAVALARSGLRGLTDDPALAIAASALAATASGAGLLAESWGPVWQHAARLGLPATGPLMIPGSWTFQ
jgi:protease IV